MNTSSNDRFDVEEFPLPDLGGASPAGSSNPSPGTEEILAGLELKWNHPPPAEPWVFKVAAIEVAHPGNLVLISAPVKMAKTATISAAIASTFALPGTDCLGWESQNPEGKAVIHIDTEQGRGDHYATIASAVKRSGRDRLPSWVHSYWLTGRTTAQTLHLFMAILNKWGPGGIHSVWIDGIGDFVSSPNEEIEVFGTVSLLQAKAIEYAAPIFSAIHFNPGTEKTRGHLGSQLERKAETVLTLRKKAGVILLVGEKCRHAPIPEAVAPAFRWDEDAGMHRSVKNSAGDTALAELRDLAAMVFKHGPLNYSGTCSAIAAACDCVRKTAEKKFTAMNQAGVIRKNMVGFWEMVPPPPPTPQPPSKDPLGG